MVQFFCYTILCQRLTEYSDWHADLENRSPILYILIPVSINVKYIWTSLVLFYTDGIHFYL